MVSRAGSVHDDATTRSSSGTGDSSSHLFAEPEVSAFVIAWCRAEPGRIGELAIIPPTSAELVLGRGAPDSQPRMRFYRPQPGRLEPTAPLASRGLSRIQAEIRPGPERIGVGLDTRAIHRDRSLRLTHGFPAFRIRAVGGTATGEHRARRG